jgi:hypothetical protein
MLACPPPAEPHLLRRYNGLVAQNAAFRTHTAAALARMQAVCNTDLAPAVSADIQQNMSVPTPAGAQSANQPGTAATWACNAGAEAPASDAQRTRLHELRKLALSSDVAHGAGVAEGKGWHAGPSANTPQVDSDVVAHCRAIVNNYTQTLVSTNRTLVKQIDLRRQLAAYPQHNSFNDAHEDMPSPTMRILPEVWTVRPPQ